MTIVRVCQDIFISWIVEQSTEKISSNTLWPTLLVRQIYRSIRCCEGSCVVMKVHQWAQNGILSWWPYLVVLWQYWCHCSSEGTEVTSTTKHILHRYHLIWEIMDQGDVELQKIDKKENLTNPFTKILDVKEFEDYKSKMGIWYCTDWL